MRSSKFNVVIDGQHGSTGKGLIASYLAWQHRPAILSTTNLPNAGHTAVWTDGVPHVAKALPSPTALNAWMPDYNPAIYVGPTAAFELNQLLTEYTVCSRPTLFIHPRAGVVTSEHRAREQAAGSSVKLIASTMQGCGAFLSDKIMRIPGLKLARDWQELAQFIPNDYMPEMLNNQMIDQGATVLHEGSQGFSLDISHGSDYPQCTSRSCTALQAATDMGVPAALLGDVYLVVRPYPIRVGNVVEEGVTVGHSGGCYPDNEETTWEAVAATCGAPREEIKELTTVTKRLRRVFTYSARQVKLAAMVNGATKIALNFVNYIDWNCRNTNDPKLVTDKIKKFIDQVERDTGVPVTLLGTGPQVDHVIRFRQKRLRRCVRWEPTQLRSAPLGANHLTS